MTSSAGQDAGSEQFNHPQLTPEQDAVQRGGDPVPPHHDAAPTAPIYNSDATRRSALDAALSSIRGQLRYRQDLLLPYLLIRSFPGDHGIRPFPQNSPSWEFSPDVMAVPGTPGQVQTLSGATPASSVADGQPYTVFVRVWNLGLLSAIGATLNVYATYAISPVADQGFMTWSPVSLVGQGFFDLPDCYSPDCRTVLKLQMPWVPHADNAIMDPNHPWAWLVARVSCFADVAPDQLGKLGDWGVTADRHVAVASFAPA